MQRWRITFDGKWNRNTICWVVCWFCYVSHGSNAHLLYIFFVPRDGNEANTHNTMCLYTCVYQYIDAPLAHKAQPNVVINGCVSLKLIHQHLTRFTHTELRCIRFLYTTLFFFFCFWPLCFNFAFFFVCVLCLTECNLNFFLCFLFTSHLQMYPLSNHQHFKTYNRMLWKTLQLCFRNRSTTTFLL